ncbi:ABC transporter substrate-binding protein [Paenibacillus ginsengarvi]|uniref:Extracellular solute-binding protein n=1 Tax=Paenibacillus ginsengarvi TaxID=400777 RepID=A0A3B0BF84_9BACL|nr:extracellular solute-binding protein [Paenibacillus ginsengarvi]RKN70676.1 extracellular solute-binding protein [Paenibacillus ginsengarvi]
MRLWKKTMLFGLCLPVLALSACSSGSGTGGDQGDKTPTTAPKQISNDPVTLTIYYYGGDLTDEEFQTYFVKPVGAKYPHLTLKLVRNAPGTKLEDLVASGATPDLIYSPKGYMEDFIGLSIVQDLDSFVREQKMDLSRFEPVTIDSLKSYAPKYNMIALPFSYNNSALFYNKDIFDKFGVPYPVDKMTWDEVIELGKRISRKDGDTFYKAMYPSQITQFASQFAVPYTDPKTGAPTLERDDWKKAATYFKRIYDLPENRGTKLNNFFVERDVAMYAGVTTYTFGQVKELMGKGTPLGWDMVSYPNFPETKGQSMALDSLVLLMTSTSKYKDQVFRVMDVVTSNDSQLALSKVGRMPALKDPQLKAAFGSDNPALQGKNVKSLFLNTPPVQNLGQYDLEVLRLLNTLQPKLINDEEDVNTFLRNASEQAKLKIEEKKAASR